MTKKLSFLTLLMSVTLFAARVTTTVHPHANQETIVTEVLAAASQAMPGSAPSANIVRDANGKVVQVQVNLPDNDAPGLASAKQAIQNNSGVAASIAFPFTVYNSDFNSLTPDSVLADLLTDSNGTIRTFNSSVSPTNLWAAKASESFGAIGSAIRVGEESVGGDNTLRSQGSLQARASDNNIASIGATQVSFRVKVDGVAGNKGTIQNAWNSAKFLARFKFYPSDLIAYNTDPLSPGLTWIIENDITQVAHNTNVPITTFVKIDGKIDSLGNMSVSVDGSLVSALSGTDFPPVAKSFLNFLTVSRSSMGHVGTDKMIPVIFDDVKFDVLSLG